MKKFSLILTIFFLVAALLTVLLIAIFDNAILFKAAGLVKDNIWVAGILLLLFLGLLFTGIGSNLARSEGSLFTNGYFQMAMLELFLCAAGLVYYRHHMHQLGQIVLRIAPEKKLDSVNLGFRSPSGAVDTVTAPGVLKNLPAGKYSFEILDREIIYFRTDLILEPAESETLTIPVVLDVKTLTVQSEPAGAEIWFNGLQTSQTPDTFEILTGDTVVMELKLPGYQGYTDTIALNNDMDLGSVRLYKLYMLRISTLYDYTQYLIYDMEGQVVFTGTGLRRVELPEGRYRIAYEIGEGQYKSKTFSLNSSYTVYVP